jgi:hypothetical protein
MVAAIKAGYKVRIATSQPFSHELTGQVLFISPRNSQEGQINLFDKTDCHILAFPKSHHNTAQPWLEERNMKAIEVGDMDRWFPEKEVHHFPYNKTYEDAEWDPVVVLHTSGSTGLPKPVIARVGMISVGDAWSQLGEFQGGKFLFNGWAERAKRHFLPSEYCPPLAFTVLCSLSQCHFSMLQRYTVLSTWSYFEAPQRYSALNDLCHRIS